MRHQQKDDRIRYIRHEKNYGTGKGFNTANHAARGKYVTYLDDDDIWHPKKLEKQVKKFEQCSEKVGFITGGVQYWNSDTGKKLRKWIPNQRGDVYWESLGTSGNIFGPPSAVMIRKTVLQEIGEFKEDMPRGCCQQYFRRIAKKYEIDYIEDIILDYYYHKNAITAVSSKEDILNCIITLEIKIKSNIEDLEKIQNTYANELAKLGHYHCLYGEMDRGYTYFQKAFIVIGPSIPLSILSIGSKIGNKNIYKIFQWLSTKTNRLNRLLSRRNKK